MQSMKIVFYSAKGITPKKANLIRNHETINFENCQSFGLQNRFWKMKNEYRICEHNMKGKDFCFV